MDRLPKRKKIRIPGYNYSQNGIYFVTICTDKHKCILGNISSKDSFLEESKFAENGSLVGANCVRPPEVNLSDAGEIIYNEINTWNETYEFVSIDNFVIMPNHLHLLISIDADIYGRTQFAPTLSRMVKQFKGSVTRKLGYPIWQKSFYEHVIRNETDYCIHYEYIDNNPVKWETDDYYIK